MLRDSLVPSILNDYEYANYEHPQPHHYQVQQRPFDRESYREYNLEEERYDREDGLL